MAKYLDEAFWRESLSKPNWYSLLADDFARLESLAKQQEGKPGYKQIKREAYELVEESVRIGRIPFAQRSYNFDTERQPIDTIVIHHTKNPSGMTLDRLNAMHLLRIYGMYFANPTDAKEKKLKGLPVGSGHYYKGAQVFWGYHWFVREDGSCEQILKDEYIGWHAGNWNINTRSVGICIDDDLSDKEPSDKVLITISNIIKTYYPIVNRAKILGHKDVNSKTLCPGSLFHSIWQRKIIGNYLNR